MSKRRPSSCSCAASPAFAKVSKFGDSYFAIPVARVDLALCVFVLVFFVGIFYLLRREQP